MWQFVLAVCALQDDKNTSKNAWVHTGDVAIKDEEGFIYIVDRIKNMFISGGENVYPLEIEKVLNEHPDINEVVVIGIPHDKWGETGRAIVNLKAHKNLTLEELQTFCSNKLSKYKIPSSLIITTEFPKTETGKIDRKSLSKTYGQ